MPLLAPVLFATALVHANGSLLVAAVLPRVPSVAAPVHPLGLDEGEQLLISTLAIQAAWQRA